MKAVLNKFLKKMFGSKMLSNFQTKTDCFSISLFSRIMDNPLFIYFQLIIKKKLNTKYTNHCIAFIYTAAYS